MASRTYIHPSRRYLSSGNKYMGWGSCEASPAGNIVLPVMNPTPPISDVTSLSAVGPDKPVRETRHGTQVPSKEDRAWARFLCRMPLLRATLQRDAGRRDAARHTQSCMRMTGPGGTNTVSSSKNVRRKQRALRDHAKKRPFFRARTCGSPLGWS